MAGTFNCMVTPVGRSPGSLSPIGATSHLSNARVEDSGHGRVETRLWKFASAAGRSAKALRPSDAGQMRVCRGLAPHSARRSVCSAGDRSYRGEAPGVLPPPCDT